MAVRIQNITNEAHQRHILIFEESEITLVMRHHPTVEMWAIDVEYKGRAAYGFRLSADVLHMRSQNFPFDFVVRDLAGAGLDPYRADDFATDRCALYLLDAADMEVVRDGPVPL